MEENGRQQWRLAFRCQFLPTDVCAWAETNTAALEYLVAQVGDGYAVARTSPTLLVISCLEMCLSLHETHSLA